MSGAPCARDLLALFHVRAATPPDRAQPLRPAPACRMGWQQVLACALPRLALAGRSEATRDPCCAQVREKRVRQQGSAEVICPLLCWPCCLCICASALILDSTPTLCASTGLKFTHTSTCTGGHSTPQAHGAAPLAHATAAFPPRQQRQAQLMLPRLERALQVRSDTAIQLLWVLLRVAPNGFQLRRRQVQPNRRAPGCPLRHVGKPALAALRHQAAGRWRMVHVLLAVLRGGGRAGRHDTWTSQYTTVPRSSPLGAARPPARRLCRSEAAGIAPALQRRRAERWPERSRQAASENAENANGLVSRPPTCMRSRRAAEGQQHCRSTRHASMKPRACCRLDRVPCSLPHVRGQLWSPVAPRLRAPGVPAP